MKIIHCIWNLNTGGAETMLVDIANEQAKAHDVSVIIVNNLYEQVIIDKFSEKIQVFCLNRRPRSLSFFPFVKLNRILWTQHPDVIHVHGNSLPRVIWTRASHGLFMTVHALHLSLSDVRHGVKLIAISDAVREDIQSRGDYHVITIPNGIHIAAIEPRDTSKGYAKDGIFRIVQVARLDADKKGQDILIRAIAMLKSKGFLNIQLDFIGSGASEEMLRNLTKELSVEHQVRFLGLRDRAYIYSHLKEYDLMCHPSRYEGFGLTVAEGIAAKLPVLVANEGGPYEIIKKGEFGYAFQSGSVEDCAIQIENIISNYSAALEKIPAAYHYVEDNYSLQRMVEEYIKAYKA